MSALQDGPTPDTRPDTDRLGPGVRVVDREDPEPDPAVVVNLPPVPAEEWRAYQDRDGEPVTVAEDNPEYDPEADVAIVVFEEDLERAHPGYEGEKPLPLKDIECRRYAFPPGRLERLEPPGGSPPSGSETRGRVEDRSENQLGDGMTDLREHLQDVGADVATEHRDGEAVLVVEKLGREHWITPDGEVSSGPLAEDLEELAEEYLGGGSP